MLFTPLAIYVSSIYFEGLSFTNIKTLLIASLVLVLSRFLVKPLLKIITLPINFLTLGLFSWVIDAAMLYLTSVVVAGFTIAYFFFEGFKYNSFTVPSIELGGILAYGAFSFIIFTIVGVLNWICS